MRTALRALATLLCSGLAWSQLDALPPGPGRDLAFTKCQQCHDLGYVLDSAGLDRAAWEDILRSMVDAGLELTDPEFATLLDYFSTYMGENPPPSPAEAEARTASNVRGIEVYKKACVACHGEDGGGVPGAFPPLRENPHLYQDRAYPALVVLFGLEGPIEIRGETFDGLMPSFAHLSDEEIAAVVAYIRRNFGNDNLRPSDFADLSPEEVRALRDRGLLAKEVHALRGGGH